MNAVTLFSGTLAGLLRQLRTVVRDPIVVIAALLILVGTVSYYTILRGFIFDDAYISYRFAQNAAEGSGLVFNVGERIFGTSSPLNVLVLGLLGALGLDIADSGDVLFALAVGALSILGFASLHRSRSSIAGLLFVSWVFLGLGGLRDYWGLETALYIALLLGSVQAARNGREAAAGVLAGLAILARYDGGIGALVLATLIGVQHRRFPLRYAMAGCAVVVPWLVFAQLYYGTVLPQTLSAKAHSVPTLRYLSTILDYHILNSAPLRDIQLWNLGHPFYSRLSAFLLAGGVFAGFRKAASRDLFCLYYGFTAALLWIGYGIIGPPPEHSWHLASATVLAGLFCLTCWSAAWPRREQQIRQGSNSSPSRRSWWRSWPLAVAITVGLLTVALVPPRTANRRNMITSDAAYRSRAGAYREMAQWIRSHGLEGLTVLTAEPGYFSYLSGNPVIDLAGLVTKGSYLHGPQERRTGLAEAIESSRPDLIVMPPSTVPGSTLTGYSNVFNSFASRILLLREDLYQQHLAGTDTLQPSAGSAEPALRGTWSIRAEDGIDTINAMNALGGFLPVPSRVVAGRQRRLVFASNRTSSPWSAMETPLFAIDFDRLNFDFEGSHATRTVVQLVINGQVVLQEGGRPKKKVGRLGVLRRISWSMVPCEGRNGRLRFVDLAPDKHRIAFESIRAVKADS